MSNTQTDPLPDPKTLRDALRQVIDPEVGMNVVDLGLIYQLDVVAGGSEVTVDMTMTSPACPMGEMIVAEVKTVLREHLPESVQTEVRLVWNPPWSPELMSEDARKHFGW